MPLSVKHDHVSPKVDAPDSTLIRPADWNSEHDLTTTGFNLVLGRDPTGPGDIQELPLSVDLDGNVAVQGTGRIRLPLGTTGQRPPVPSAGDIRWNTTNACLEIYGLGGASAWTQLTSGALPPPGTVAMFAGLSTPVGWLFCNGQAMNRITDAALFAAIGTTYGAGDASTTFNIPNYQGRVPVHPNGAQWSLNTRRGILNTTVTLTTANMPAHTHALSPPLVNASGTNTGGVGSGSAIWGGGGPNATLPAGSGTPVTISTEQPSFGINFMIKR